MCLILSILKHNPEKESTGFVRWPWVSMPPKKSRTTVGRTAEPWAMMLSPKGHPPLTLKGENKGAVIISLKI